MKARIGSLPELLAADRNAGSVWLALLHLACGRRRFTATRPRIREVCGLCDRRITLAIAALKTSGWVGQTYGRNGIYRWYRITIPAGEAALSYVTKKAPKENGRKRCPMVPKRTHRKTKRTSEKIPKENVSYVTKKIPTLVRERDAENHSAIPDPSLSPPACGLRPQRAELEDPEQARRIELAMQQDDFGDFLRALPDPESTAAR